MLMWIWIWDLVKRLAPLAIGLIALLVIVGSLAMCTHAFSADLALGDSIALGTGHALRMPTQAVTGAGSCAIADWRHRGSYGHVVISAGINDSGLCVLAVRASVRAMRVIWILPAPINGGREMVLQSMRIGDRFVSYTCPGKHGCTRSNFHPASYAAVARAVRRQW